MPLGQALSPVCEYHIRFKKVEAQLIFVSLGPEIAVSAFKIASIRDIDTAKATLREAVKSYT
jgi:hypothetical protein